MKIVIISITQYKEKDAIIDAISEEGEVTFLAKGVLNPKNANAAINNLLAIADIELQEGNYKYPVLKNASILLNPLKTNNDFDYLASLMVIGEATKALLQDEEKAKIFDSLVTAITTLKKIDEPWFVLLVYLARVLKQSGYEFEVNRCVFCGSKNNIRTFSFKDGGFVCNDCLDETTEMGLTKDQMLLIRAAFNSQTFETTFEGYNKENALVVLNKFFEFINDAYGLTLKSQKLIIK